MKKILVYTAVFLGGMWFRGTSGGQNLASKLPILKNQKVTVSA